MNLTELETLAMKATPGKRHLVEIDGEYDSISICVPPTRGFVRWEPGRADWEWIAACSPETILALVRIVRAADETLCAYRLQTLRRWMRMR